MSTGSAEESPAQQVPKERSVYVGDLSPGVNRAILEKVLEKKGLVPIKLVDTCFVSCCGLADLYL
jgi:hypothetical protein